MRMLLIVLVALVTLAGAFAAGVSVGESPVPCLTDMECELRCGADAGNQGGIE